jgi:hypothetical protein
MWACAEDAHHDHLALAVVVANYRRRKETPGIGGRLPT